MYVSSCKQTVLISNVFSVSFFETNSSRYPTVTTLRLAAADGIRTVSYGFEPRPIRAASGPLRTAPGGVPRAPDGFGRLLEGPEVGWNEPHKILKGQNRHRRLQARMRNRSQVFLLVVRTTSYSGVFFNRF